MSCFLRVDGTGCDVERFLQESGWLAGGALAVVRVTSGFEVRVSRAGFDDQEAQGKDIVAFLGEHRAVLLSLVDWPGVECRLLEVGIQDRLDVAQADWFAPDLLLALGQLQIGLAISRHPRDEGQVWAAL